MLNGSTEENIITALVHNERLAPLIALKIEAQDFSTETYRHIAVGALQYLEKYKRPAGAHIYDMLEDEIKRGENGRFTQWAIDQMATLALQLNEDFVRDSLNKYVETQLMTVLLNKASDEVINGNNEEVRILAWQIVNARVDDAMLADPWAEPEPPPFDPDILPEVLRNFVIERAQSTGADPAGFFWAGLGTCSAALDGSIRLQMKANDPNFRVPPAIWVLLFGKPSIGRSTILETAWAPLEAINRQAIEISSTMLKQWEAAPKDERGSKPNGTRYIVKNITPEKLQVILAGQERGIAMFLDEWAEFIGQFERYGKSGAATARAFYLKSYDGGSYDVDRIERGHIYIRNNLLVPCGGIQPEVLRKLSINGELTDDGLLQRYITPILQPKAMGDDDARPGREVEFYNQLIEDMARIEGRRQVVRLTREARSVRMRVEERLQEWVTNDSLGPGFMTFAGKLQGLWGRLTLVLGHIYHLQNLPGGDSPEEIGENAASLAETLIFEQVLAHGAKLYNWLGGGGNLAVTQAIAGWLLTHPRGRITASDLTNNVQACRGLGAVKMADMASPLVTMGWLDPEEHRSTRWRVNQRIYTQFTERSQREIHQRGQIQSLIAVNAERRRARQRMDDDPPVRGFRLKYRIHRPA